MFLDKICTYMWQRTWEGSKIYKSKTCRCLNSNKSSKTFRLHMEISILNPPKFHYCLWNAWCEHLKPNAWGLIESKKTFCFLKLVLNNLHYLKWYMVQHLKVLERYLARGIQHSPMWKQHYAHIDSWWRKIQHWICKSTRKIYW